MLKYTTLGANKNKQKSEHPAEKKNSGISGDFNKVSAGCVVRPATDLPGVLSFSLSGGGYGPPARWCNHDIHSTVLYMLCGALE